MTNRYREARNARPMTQEELAIAAGVSVRTIRRLENGETVGAESRRAVASVLGLFKMPALARTQSAAGISLKGESKLENSLDSEGLIILDFIVHVCAVPFFLATVAGFARFRALKNGVPVQQGPFSEFMLSYSGIPLIVIGILGCIFFWSILLRRLGRSSQVDLELERTGDISIPEAVADAVSAFRTGSYDLDLSGMEAATAKLRLRFATNQPELLGEVTRELRECGVTARRVQPKSFFGIKEKNDFAEAYL